MSETLTTNNSNFVSYDNLGDTLYSLTGGIYDLFTMLWNQDRVIIYEESGNYSKFEQYCLNQIQDGKYPINPKHRYASNYGPEYKDSIEYIKWDALILVRKTATYTTTKQVTSGGKTADVTVDEEDTKHYGYTLWVYRYNEDPSKAELEPVNCDESMGQIYEYVNDELEDYAYTTSMIDLTNYNYIFNYNISNWISEIESLINDTKLPPVLPTSSVHPKSNLEIYFKCRQYTDDGNSDTQIVYVHTSYTYRPSDDSFNMSYFKVVDILPDVGFTESQMNEIQEIIGGGIPAQ